MNDPGLADWRTSISRPRSNERPGGLPPKPDVTDPTEQIRKAIARDLNWMVALSNCPANRYRDGVVEQLLADARKRVLELAADLHAYHEERHP